MALKGNIIKNSLVEVRKIKIGRKGETTTSAKGNDFRPPQKLDHFEFLKTTKDEAGNLLLDVEIIELLKKNPKTILDANGNIIGFPIRLLYNDPDLNFQARLAKYLGAVCMCTGDGEKAMDHKGKEIPCPCKYFTDKTMDPKNKCKILGKLSVVIDGDNSFGGCSVFRTTSRNTAESLLGSMRTFATMTGGLLAWLPLHLVIVPKTTQVNGVNMTVFIVSIMYLGPPEEFRKIAMTNAVENKQYLISMDEIETQAKEAMKAGTDADADEAKEISEEFFPDSVAASQTITVDAKQEEEEKPQEDQAVMQPEPDQAPVVIPEVVAPEVVVDASPMPEVPAQVAKEDEKKQAPVGPVTVEQIKQIVALRTKLGWPKVNWDFALKEFKPGCTTAKDLNTEEADRFIVWLQDDIPF